MHMPGYRWVDVLSSQYATTGRSGLGLLRDDVRRAPQRCASEGLDHEYRRSRPRSDPREPGLLTHCAYGTTARPTLGGFSTRARSSATRPARPSYPSGGAGLSSGSVRRRTRNLSRKRMEAGGPSGLGVMGRDPATSLRCRPFTGVDSPWSSSTM
jgi:hypothetical protein